MFLATLHLTVAAVWLGSMAYSLGVLQPRVARFFPDDQRREEFLQVLAHGNRWRVTAVIVTVMGSALGVIAVSPRRAVVIGYAVAMALYIGATVVFVNVSWRHWPARVFALPEELAAFRQRLRVQAWAMLGLVAAAFVAALGVSLRV